MYGECIILAYEDWYLYMIITLCYEKSGWV